MTPTKIATKMAGVGPEADTAIHLEDGLLESVEKQGRKPNVRYTDMLWKDNSQLQIQMTWGYDAEAVGRHVTISLFPNGAFQIGGAGVEGPGSAQE